MTDDQLLSRFIAARDEESFATLVRRHGPLVLAVCRRVSGDDHLADEAFQAAFLVLARRAVDVKPAGSVRAWLYGVAVRTAREARTMSTRRTAREVPVPTVPDRPAPIPEPLDADALRALEEEIGRLPDHQRTAVVLCELDSLGRREAADRLGIPEGTLASRLAKARKTLRARLRARGVTCPLVGVAAALLPSAAMAVRPGLTAATVRLSCSGPVSARVAEIARGVYRTMFLKKLLLTVALVTTAVVGLVVASAGEPAAPPLPDPRPPAVVSVAPIPQPAAAQAVKAAGPNRIFITGNSALVSVTPGGKDEQKYEVPEQAPFWAVPAPDGRRIAYVEEAVDGKGETQFCVIELKAKAEPRKVKLPANIGYFEFCWSPDGTRIHACAGMMGKRGVQHFRLNVKDTTLQTLDILKTQTVDDWSADGKSLVTTEVGDGEEWEPKAVRLANLDGTNGPVLVKGKGWVSNGRLSPDGKRVLVVHEGRLAVAEVGKPETLTDIKDGPEHIERGEFDWSPDGKRIVFRRQKGTPEERGDVEVVVSDPNGENATIIRSSKGDGVWKVSWR